MKVLLLLCVLFIGCGLDKRTPVNYSYSKTHPDVSIALYFDRYNDNIDTAYFRRLVLDSCEYWYSDLGERTGVMTHNGKCRFCRERLRKEFNK